MFSKDVQKCLPHPQDPLLPCKSRNPPPIPGPKTASKARLSLIFFGQLSLLVAVTWGGHCGTWSLHFILGRPACCEVNNLPTAIQVLSPHFGARLMGLCEALSRSGRQNGGRLGMHLSGISLGVMPVSGIHCVRQGWWKRDAGEVHLHECLPRWVPTGRMVIGNG